MELLQLNKYLSPQFQDVALVQWLNPEKFVEIRRIDRGIYAFPEVWEDEIFFIQYSFSKGIFLH